MRLTDEQILAVASDHLRVNIVASPGSGKTTVAAERIGYLSVSRDPLRRGVLGISFTRAATVELKNRVESRWGRGILTFPNAITTFDQLYVDLLNALLAKGHVRWPGNHTTIRALDTYGGLTGFRGWITQRQWKRYATIGTTRQVESVSRRVNGLTNGISQAAHHRAAMSSGHATHEDVRCVIAEVLEHDGLRREAGQWLRGCFHAVVVDEVYDADLLDVEFVKLALEKDLSVTLIGDPRQAIYEWRGAVPTQVNGVVRDQINGFRAYELTRSFRFRGDQMPALATTLRAGRGVSLPSISPGDIDVAIGRTWSDLWCVGDGVLPLAFGQIKNQSDAALTLLLDSVTRRTLGRRAYAVQTAQMYLGLDGEGSDEIDGLTEIRELMVSGRSGSEIVQRLRDVVWANGLSRRIRALGAENEQKCADNMERLALRLRRDTVVPGLTVHQAKGGEWTRVGLAVRPDHVGTVAEGLNEQEAEHCVLYVALTRASEACGVLETI